MIDFHNITFFFLIGFLLKIIESTTHYHAKVANNSIIVLLLPLVFINVKQIKNNQCFEMFFLNCFTLYFMRNAVLYRLTPFCNQITDCYS